MSASAGNVVRGSVAISINAGWVGYMNFGVSEVLKRTAIGEEREGGRERDARRTLTVR